MQSNIKYQLNNSPLEYRDMLTLPREVRFGLEIELENVDYDKVYSLVRRQLGRSYIVKTDKSLIQGSNAEIATPVLKNERDTWKQLKKLAMLLSEFHPTFEHCGFQINFDGLLLPREEDRIKFLKLYSYYEDIIYKFSKGEDTQYRSSLDIYAAPILLSLKDILLFGEEDRDLLLERFRNNKRYGVIFKTENKDLIEFRTPNGTIHPILWQNYITFFYYLIMLTYSNKIDKKEIDAYIKKYSRLDMLESYELLREEKAVSLSKKMFLNQRDRISFLHQYFR